MNRIIVNSRSGINLSLKSSGWTQTSVVLGKSNPLDVYTERIWIERTAIAFRRMNSWRLSVVRGVLVIWGEVEREAETWECALWAPPTSASWNGVELNLLVNVFIRDQWPSIYYWVRQLSRSVRSVVSRSSCILQLLCNQAVSVLLNT